MAYCTLADIRNQIPDEKLVELTDDEHTGQIVTRFVDEAILSAQAEIDPYCQARYSVPFAPVPAVIRKFAIDIAIYNLFCRRGFDPSQDSPDQIILIRYKNAIKFLENVAKEVVSIGPVGAQSAAETVQDASRPAIVGPGRVFSRQNLEGF